MSIRIEQQNILVMSIRYKWDWCEFITARRIAYSIMNEKHFPLFVLDMTGISDYIPPKKENTEHKFMSKRSIATVENKIQKDDKRDKHPFIPEQVYYEESKPHFVPALLIASQNKYHQIGQDMLESYFSWDEILFANNKESMLELVDRFYKEVRIEEWVTTTDLLQMNKMQ